MVGAYLKRGILILTVLFFPHVLKAEKEENGIDLNENITFYNNYKTTLNNIGISIDQNEINTKNEFQLSQLTIHSSRLDKHIKRLSNHKYTYRFLHSIFLSNVDLRLQIDQLLSDTKDVLKNINALNEKLNYLKENNQIEEQFSGKFNYFKNELTTQMNQNDSNLRELTSYYTNFEYRLLRLQSKALSQSEILKSFNKEDFQFSSSNTESNLQNISLYNAFVITSNVKTDLITFYLSNRINIVYWLIGCFVFSFFIFLSFQKRAIKHYQKQPESYHFGHNKGNHTFLFFLFKFSFITPLFFPKSPWIIGEIFLLSSLILMNVLLYKSNLDRYFKLSLLTLSISFFMISVYNILIIHFKGETIYFTLIHILLFASTFLFYKANSRIKQQGNLVFKLIWSLTFLFQIITLVLFFKGFVNFERFLISGILHLLVAVYLFIFFIRSNQQFIGVYLNFLHKKLPQYFENDIFQMGKILRLVVWSIAIIAFFKIFFSAFNLDFMLLDLLTQISFKKFEINGHTFSFTWVVLTIALLISSFIVAQTLSFFLDYFSNQIVHRNFNFKVVAKLLVYLMSLYIFFIYSGMELEKLTIAVSAIGFGIGFGLQSVLANSISGLIILIERKIRIDDRVDIDGKSGVIKEIGGRSVRVYIEDGTDLLIPSSDFISKSVRNWNLGDTKNRTEIKFSLSPTADIEKAIQLINEIIDQTKTINSARSKETCIINIDPLGAHISTFFWFESKVNERSEISRIIITIYKQFKENQIDFFTTKSTT